MRASQVPMISFRCHTVDFDPGRETRLSPYRDMPCCLPAFIKLSAFSLLVISGLDTFTYVTV